jgi:hypothetical protein
MFRVVQISCQYLGSRENTLKRNRQNKKTLYNDSNFVKIVSEIWRPAAPAWHGPATQIPGRELFAQHISLIETQCVATVMVQRDIRRRQRRNRAASNRPAAALSQENSDE